MALHLRFWWVVGTVTLSGLTLPDLARSQISADGTLNTQVRMNGNAYLINQGTRVGNNLFHSFKEFSIEAGKTAEFQNSLDITNILARVTGNDPSRIFGTIRTAGKANLFLMNPNGILFGSGARLQIGGSFVATTADAIEFPQNGTVGKFSAKPSSADTLLSVNPSALFFNQLSTKPPGTIQVDNGAILRVPSPQTLMLVGGTVQLNDGMLIARQGRIDVAAIAGGSVPLTLNDRKLLQLSPSANTVFDDVSVAGANLNVEPANTGTGGDIHIQGRNVILNSNGVTKTQLLARGVETGRGGNVKINAEEQVALANTTIQTDGTRLQNSSVGAGAGSIFIQSKDSIVLAAGTQLTNDTYGSGKGGDIQLNGRLVRLENGATLKARTLGSGAAGAISVNADDQIQLAGATISTTSAPGATGSGGTIALKADGVTIAGKSTVASATSGAGAAGNIDIQTNSLVVTGDSQLTATTTGTGRAGNILIDTNSLLLTGNSQLTATTTGTGSAGNILINRNRQGSVVISNATVSTASEPAKVNQFGQGGDIAIQADSIALSNGVISASTRGGGNAGSILLSANRIDVNGGTPIAGFIASGVYTSTVGSGAAGTLNVDAGQLQIRGGARISASTKNGAGQGGDLKVNAAASVELTGSGSGLFTEAAKDSLVHGSVTGNAGNIQVTTPSLTVRDGALISSQTATDGDAGNIVLKVADQVTLTGSESGLFANTAPGSTGKGGSIIVDPKTLLIQNGAAIAVGSQGSGKGGDIQIEAGTLTLRDRGSISATTASTQGGNIALQIHDFLFLRNHSLISTTAGNNQSGGDGGNIQINAPFIISIANENNDISANAFTGRGGRVDITAQGIFGIQPRDRLTPLSDITASSEFGIAGVVTINTPNVDPSRGLTELPANLVDASNQIAQGCSANTRQATNSFVITGRGGLPANPAEVLGNDAVVTEWATVQGDRVTNKNEGAEKIIQATRKLSEPTAQPAAIVEAQTWVVDRNGSVVLVAQPQVAQSTPMSFSSTACNPPSKATSAPKTP